ncbi:carbonate dehydratase [Haoranjiania flava]|uniref:Carbonic anhydrase 2 n=1 Tax=Haoranjiania flava TaxID=1856322 RepID=A0AAE3ILJ1_9BACT|nr:carbonate dehydratase [Haoranjiania flava]MCU7693156.1 carbonate dehydratase [Haoranjiania flava]
MNDIDKILQSNKDWAKYVSEEEPDFFPTLAKLQSPKFLWIGCSDSRVPADQITNTKPGEIFVHRNIANLVIHTDVNLLSVLDYAVRQLKVEHVIVCGHYGCGGVNAAMSNNNFDIVLNMWLRNIKDVYRMHSDELDKIDDDKQRSDRLVELNVVEQVKHLAKTSIIQRAWKHHQMPQLHGWVYGLDNGLIKTIYQMNHDSEIDGLYVYTDL